MSIEYVAKADLTSTIDSFKTKVSETVRAQFGTLFPKEVFDDLVQTEIDWFFNGDVRIEMTQEREQGPGSYNGRYIHLAKTYMTPFRQMVYNEMVSVVREKLRTWLEEQKEALNEQFELTMNSEEVAKPFNQGIVGLAATVQQAQVVQGMTAAIDMCRQQINAVLDTIPGIPRLS